jgi:hypothetical protein
MTPEMPNFSDFPYRSTHNALKNYKKYRLDITLKARNHCTPKKL